MNKKVIWYNVIQLIVTLIFCNNSLAQITKKEKLFTQPLDSAIILAGTFGEIRTNHFHSGLDISTGGVEGKKVMAAADGYVSRIKVSADGFGKAIYMTHKNGYVTVYGHLQRFSASIEKYIRAEQYRNESFEVEMFPSANEFVFKRGEMIALSGNTGGSGGPHLHFEIRDGKTEEPLEPEAFGYQITDSIAPVINSIAIYPLHNKGSVNKSCEKIIIPVKLKGKIYTISDASQIIVNGETGFGIEVSDKQCQNGSVLGIKKIELFIDDKMVYDYSFDRFRFDESRFVNANIDYAESVSAKREIILCYRLPGNEFSMTKRNTMTGIINLEKDENHTGLFRVYDFSNNISQASFSFKSTAMKSNCSEIKANDTTFLISYDKPFAFGSADIKLNTDKLPVVYEDTYLTITGQKQTGNYFSKIFKTGDAGIPVHNAISISIRPVNLPDAIKSKALLVKIESNGKLSSAGGSLANGFVTTKIRSFGNFAVTVDTIPPTIKATDLSSVKAPGKIKFRIKIKDELSGIGSYRAEVNKQWMLMEYDSKTGTLTGEMNLDKKNINYRFVLTVSDKKGNKSEYVSVIKY